MYEIAKSQHQLDGKCSISKSDLHLDALLRESHIGRICLLFIKVPIQYKPPN